MISNPTNLVYPTIRATGNVIFNGRTEWILFEDFSLRVPMGRSQYEFFVPAGMTTDFASIPRLFTFLISPVDPKILAAALIHDDLYKSRSKNAVSKTIGQDTPLHTKITHQKTSRFMADAWLREIMRLYEAPLWKQFVVYYAVRGFGWLAYQKGDD